MGMSSSKMDNSPLLRLCEERKELMGAAADCRYRLAAAHVMYLESLLDVGNALNQFVAEELLVLSDFSVGSSDDDDDDELSSLSELPQENDSPHNTRSPALHGQSNSQAHSPPGGISFPHHHVNAIASCPQHVNWEKSPQKSPNQDDGSYNDRAESSTPPPPIINNADWYYLNPFTVIDDVNSYYCPIDSDQDFRQVREREGIPDLEDETKPNSVKVSLVKESSLGTVSLQAPILSQEKEKSDRVTIEKDLSGRPDTNITTEDEDISISEDGIHTHVKDTVTQLHGEFLELSSLTTSSDDCLSKNINEIVKEIGDVFHTVFDYGKEVAILLEAGKLPYRLKLKGVASRIFGTLLQSNQLAPRNMITGKATNDNFGDISRKFGDLSSTLEQLLAWEKKLYVEVLGEEKLRIKYDNKYKQRKVLDEEGAEYCMVDGIHSSVRRLLSKINVVITAVEKISRRIHGLRDETLLAQLKELIEGLMRMWDMMVKCHQKQFRSIIRTKAYVHMANADSRKSSNMRATKRLEKVIINWGSSFRDYVNTQKDFAKFLNEWLLRCIFQEPAATPDGIPTFSPSTIGAPPIFTICNDWHYAIQKVSDSEVYEAIQNFALSLHRLWEKQNEEQQERQKAMHLSKDFEKQLKILNKESGLHWQKGARLNHFEASEVFTESGLDIDLVSMNKRLEEQKARHEEVLKQLNDAASSCLPDGLVPIFEGLEKFCLENLKGYEQIRYVNTPQSEKASQ